MDIHGDLEDPLESVNDLRNDNAVSIQDELGLIVMVGVVVSEAQLGHSGLGGCTSASFTEKN
jgi:hypothetical protein